ncbi:MAG TPA: TMEM175 family protein [Actinomycetota bacterium]|nr:TMEM175 family protein [Actinomycetota bacterium]
MEDDERAGQAGFGRTLALSDGIFAIAMTLVAFQIQTPNSGVHLTAALKREAPSYGVFALTFFVIGRFWMGHHRLFSRMKRVDDRMMGINLFLLAAIAVLPFPSGVLGRFGNQSVAVALYAANMVAVGGLLGLLTLTASRRHLLMASMDGPAVRRALWRSWSVVIVFGISIPVAFLSPSVAAYLWIALMPVLFGLRRLESRGGRGSRLPGT